MRSRNLRKLTSLMLIGLILAPLAVDSSALAAGTGVKTAHKSHAVSHHSASSLCARPLRFSADQLIPAVLSLPLVPGPNDALTIDGVRVPIGDCGPATIDPYTGEAIDNRPTQSGSAWIAHMKQQRSQKSARRP